MGVRSNLLHLLTLPVSLTVFLDSVVSNRHQLAGKPQIWRQTEEDEVKQHRQMP